MTQIWLTDLADVLRDAGLPVVEMRYESGPYKGKTWDRVGFGGAGLTELRSVMYHHDSSPAGPSGGCKIDAQGFGYAPTGALWWCMNMSIAPAASVWIDFKGVVHIYAAGLANHAGAGAGDPNLPANLGNSYSLGVEVDAGAANEGYNPAQLDAIRRLAAAVCTRYELDPRKAVTFHRVYAPGRKTDPLFLTLEDERAAVAALMQDPRIKKLEGRLTRTQTTRDKAKASGTSTAGLPSKIRALKERLTKIRG